MHTDDFLDIPQDDDTRIMKREIITVGGYSALHERWVWDGVLGFSIIFHTADVQDKSDEELRLLASEVVDISPFTTIIRRDKYTFVNYEFVTDPF
jgi:hypothetical protein